MRAVYSDSTISIHFSIILGANILVICVFDMKFVLPSNYFSLLLCDAFNLIQEMKIFCIKFYHFWRKRIFPLFVLVLFSSHVVTSLCGVIFLVVLFIHFYIYVLLHSKNLTFSIYIRFTYFNDLINSIFFFYFCFG